MHRKTFLVAVVFASLQVSTPSLAQTSSYAGQQTRDIKALSGDEVKNYLAGAGAGFARAAELNSYPGPMHALELANELDLNTAQRVALKGLMDSHKEQTRGLGAEVVRLERELDALYAQKRATGELVEAKAMEIGIAQARYRAAHLTTHLETVRLLTTVQIARYDQIRGYTEIRPGDAQGDRHGGHVH